jgi:hypothetical protein
VRLVHRLTAVKVPRSKQLLLWISDQLKFVDLRLETHGKINLLSPTLRVEVFNIESLRGSLGQTYRWVLFRARSARGLMGGQACNWLMTSAISRAFARSAQN